MSTKRYNYLDNLKWVVAVLVITHHSASISGLDPIGFNLPQVIKSMQWQYNILGNFQGINQSFFMSLFFFISAYFVYPSLIKKGSYHFILDKLKRLGIPTLITIFIITPIAAYLSPAHTSYIGVLKYYASLLAAGNMQLGVTWFCWTLIVFNILFVIIYKLFPLRDESSKFKKIPAISTIVIFAFVMIAFNYLGLYLQNRLGENFLGLHDLKYFPTYIAMFYFGIKAYQHQWFDQITLKYGFAGILSWLFAYAFLQQILSGYGFDGYVLMRGFTTVGMSLFLIFVFKTLFNTKGKLSAMLSRVSYAAYVIQVISLVTIASVYRAYMTQVPLINFVIIAIPAVILSFFLGYLICKIPILRRIF